MNFQQNDSDIPPFLMQMSLLVTELPREKSKQTSDILHPKLNKKTKYIKT